MDRWQFGLLDESMTESYPTWKWLVRSLYRCAKAVWGRAGSIALRVFPLFSFPLLLIAAAVARLRKISPSGRSQSFADMKFVVGIDEISGIIRDLALLLEDEGAQVSRISRRIPPESSYYDFPRPRSSPSESGPLTGLRLYFSVASRGFSEAARWDELVQEAYWACLLARHMLEADCFLFVGRRTLMRLNLDFPLIRLSGAQLVVIHTGNDVRCGHLHDEIFKSYAPGITNDYYEGGWTEIVTKMGHQFWAEKFAHVISSPNQATFQFGRCHHFFFPQFQMLESPKEPNLRVSIVHAPSSRVIKKTAVVLEAIAMLEQESADFEFQLLEGVPNEEVLLALLRADILIDQPATWTSRLAVEGCAASCCTVAGNHSRLMRKSPNPTIQFPESAISLYEILSDLMADRARLSQKMKQCHEYWSENYSPAVTSKKLMNLLGGNGDFFEPFSNQKELLLRATRSKLEKLIITVFYHPKTLENVDDSPEK